MRKKRGQVFLGSLFSRVFVFAGGLKMTTIPPKKRATSRHINYSDYATRFVRLLPFSSLATSSVGKNDGLLSCPNKNSHLYLRPFCKAVVWLVVGFYPFPKPLADKKTINHFFKKFMKKTNTDFAPPVFCFPLR